MADLQVLVQGDTMTVLDFTVSDATGAVKDMTNSTVRLFVRGQETGDRPETTPLSIAALSYTTSAKQITRSSGDFVADGVVPGMLVVDENFPEGTQVLTVATSTVTLTHLATAAGTTVAVRFWGGVPGTIISGPNGTCRFSSVGTKLNLAAAGSDTYRGRVQVKDTGSGAIGWSNDAVAVVEFRGASA